MVGAVGSRKRSYKFKPILTPILLGKFVDAPIVHPLRYHFEAQVVHSRPQKWEHVLMVETFPHHNFLEETLHNCHQRPHLHCWKELGNGLHV